MFLNKSHAYCLFPFSEEDPHDAILSLFPELHTVIYQQDCVHCNPNIAEVDEQDPPETMLRLSDALGGNDFQENYVHLSVDKAKKQLMCAQGRVEISTHQVQAMSSFFEAQQNFKIAVQPILHDLRLASHRQSVSGGLSLTCHVSLLSFL